MQPYVIIASANITDAAHAKLHVGQSQPYSAGDSLACSSWTNSRLCNSGNLASSENHNIVTSNYKACIVTIAVLAEMFQNVIV